MKGRARAIIAGFKFEIDDKKRVLKSVILLDNEYNKCMEVPVISDIDIDNDRANWIF